MVIFIKGEIDHHNSSGLREYMDKLIDENRPILLVIDMSELEFMDSSGIALLIGRYKKMRDNCGSIKINNPNETISKMLRISFLDKMVGIIHEEVR